MFSWDFAWALVATILAWYFPTEAQLRTMSEQLGPIAVGVATALIGVVVAGLAVVVAFLDDDFLALIDEATKRYGGVEGQLFPFWFVTATGVGATLCAVILILVRETAPELALRVLFAAVIGLLVWTALGVFNLVASLQATGVSRAIYARSRRK
ncbi:MAG: hypothetical protein ACLGIJ_11610 [Candidatus Limnocylindria bacterium]